ncbi:MAG: hypothetical protein ABI946_04765 [Chthoniobacterales bacterium]
MRVFSLARPAIKARTAVLLATSLLGVGCAGSSPFPTADSASSIHALRHALITLDPKVSPREAGRVAKLAYTVPRRLAREYRTVGSPHFQNFLVNTGLRKRGLCFQWTEDLMRALQALRLTTLELHWAEARPGTLREHNCVVVTARGRPFQQGIVLDGWRYSGRLFWSPVSADQHYPWRKNDTGYMRRVLGESPRKTSARPPLR